MLAIFYGAPIYCAIFRLEQIRRHNNAFVQAYGLWKDVMAYLL